MKKILSIGMFISMLSLLTACGGGDTTSTVTGGGTTTPPATTPSTPTTDVSVSNDLIIDNGRGTTNNQDTETPN